MNPLLYGHNSEECIVAVNQFNDQTIRVFKRQGGAVQYSDVEFFPFFFLANPSLLDQFSKPHWLKELSGTNYYRYIAAFHRWSEMWKAVQVILKEYNTASPVRAASYMDVPPLLVRNDPVRQFLMQSGITLFKGMKAEDVVRVDIDIQFGKTVQSGKTKRLNRQLRVLTIATGSNRTVSFDTVQDDEQTALAKFITTIKAIDPDIIEGSELFSKQLPFLLRRAEDLDIDLAIGRNDTSLRILNPRTAALQSEYSATQYELFGRHLIDLGILAESYAGSKRSLHNISLPYLIKRFGTAQPPVFLQNHELDKLWKSKPKQLKEYSQRLAVAVQALGNIFLPPHIHLAQFCPLNLAALIQANTITRIETFLSREYVHQKHSLPQAKQLLQQHTSHSEILRTGVFKNVIHAEIDSFYVPVLLSRPSLSASDTLSILPQIVAALQSMKTDAGEYTGERWAIDYILSHIPAYLGSVRGLFNDPASIARIDDESKALLSEILDSLEKFNVQIIQVDRENIFFTVPDNIIGTANEEALIGRMNAHVNPQTKIVAVNKYQTMLSHKRRSYALLDRDNNVSVGGNSLIPRNAERFLQHFAIRCIGCILTEDFTRLHHLYASYYTIIMQHKWDPHDFCKTEIAKEDFEHYDSALHAGKKALVPAMEAARRGNKFVASGDVLWYYVAGSHTDVKLTDDCSLAENWNPGKPDENTHYYLTRLQETIDHLQDLFVAKAFEQIFSIDDLFGFSLPSKVLKQPQQNVISTDTLTALQDEFGIWLADTEDETERK